MKLQFMEGADFHACNRYETFPFHIFRYIKGQYEYGY